MITSESTQQYFDRFLKGRKPPPLYKSYPDKTKISLLSKFKQEKASLYDTLSKRKSVREFSTRPISFEELSKIIYFTWAKVSYYETPDFGLLIHKTSPSAGARHPTEVYVVANNVTGIGRGIYHYSVRDHSLELLKSGDFRDKCLAYCAGQEWAKSACALFIMTSVVARATWKYRVPRTYRSLLLDVGHLSQTFFLVCTAMGLGPFCTGVMCDSLLEDELAIDGVDETVIFVVGVGKPRMKRDKATIPANLL
jgi:SagB-type dehydrogenase family enzyme